MEKTVSDKFARDYYFLLERLREVLRNLDEIQIIDLLPVKKVEEASYRDPSSLPEKSSELLSLCFQLLNMAEENEAAQYRRKQENDHGLSVLPGLWGQSLKKMKEYGATEKEILDILPTIHVEPVLTAHPTEAKRTTVLEKHRELYLLLVKLENQMWSPFERKEILTEIEVVLEKLWRTGEIYLKKPDVYSEIRNIEHYLKNVFPDVLPILDTRLKHAWEDAGFDLSLLKDPIHLPQISFGDWVGGDRDGHPFVTYEVTAFVLEKFRSISLDLYDGKCIELAKSLSLSDFRQNPPKFFLDRIQKLSDSMGEIGKACVARNPDEPWRQFTNLIRKRLPSEENRKLVPKDVLYTSTDAFLHDLKILRESLECVNAGRIAEKDVFPLERLVHCFGFHMATIDIRQNSAYHEKAIEQILKLTGRSKFNYSEWSEEERIEFLNSELQSSSTFLLPEMVAGSESDSLLSTYRIISNHIRENDEKSIGAFIVSMTRSVSDLLLVYLFLRESGMLVRTEIGLASPFPVVPLFETIADLERSPSVLKDYLEYQIVKNSLDFQRNKNKWSKPLQQIMLGYSDSNKDGGILSSQWNLYSTQKNLTALANFKGVQLRFFHGRGGTISRGGGKIHRFLDALPHGSLTGSVRMTVQGETIAQKFANKINAVYNMELLVATATKITARHKYMPRKLHPGETIVAKVAKRSGEYYSELLHREKFIEFYSQATPIDIIENSRIGSRPARRTGQRTLADLRAIPWVFSWNQARFYLPNWFGAGTALEELKIHSPDEFEILQKEVEEWHFLRYVILNIETGIRSASIFQMKAYADLVEDPKVKETFLPIILNEYERTARMIEELFRNMPTEKRRPKMVETITMRAKSLEILHAHQISLLRKWRKAIQNHASDSEREMYLIPLLLTVNAIASGLRTTG